MVYNINSNLGGLSFYEDATGKYVVGADSVPKKLGDGFQYATFTVNGFGAWLSTLTFNSATYGIPTAKCVYMTWQFPNIRNSAGDVDVPVTYSYSNGVLTVKTAINSIARPNGGRLIIIYKD